MRLATNEVTVDLSGPTDCSVDGGEKRESIVARLGPDPLRADARPQLAVAAIRRSKQAIGALLLQQNVIAGIGNVYRAEALFVEGIHPQRPGASLSDDELQSLWSTVSAMLRQGVRDNRIITVDRSLLPQGRARRGEATYVYHRDTCLRCGSQVRTVRLAARDCYFCPQCQRT
jgi:endonuclease-8